MQQEVKSQVGSAERSRKSNLPTLRIRQAIRAVRLLITSEPLLVANFFEKKVDGDFCCPVPGSYTEKL